MGIRKNSIWKIRKHLIGESPQMIGLIGAGRGTGTTHLSVLMANYFCSGCGERVAVLEWNRHGDFRRFGRTCTGADTKEPVYEIQEVDFYPESDEICLAECFRKKYEKIIIDFGAIEELKSAEALRCHKVFLIVSFSEWQEGAFGNQGRWKECAAENGWQCLAAFGSEESRIQWNRRCRPTVARIPFSVDAFTVTKEISDWMKQLV